MKSTWIYRLRLNLDEATGRLRRKAEALAEQIDWSEWRASRPTVLCLERALFRKDMEQLRKRCGLNFVSIGVKAVRKPQEAWVPPEWRRQTYFTHDLDTVLGYAKEPLRAFGRFFLEAAQRRHKIEAVMAANTDYWQDDALKMACRDVGIPFLVLSRENFGIEHAREIVRDKYARAKFQFRGTAAAVASRKCADFLSNDYALRHVPVLATGWPRYDTWHDIISAPLPHKEYVTLLSYCEERYWAQNNFRETLQVFKGLATEMSGKRPDLKFVIKLKKPNEHDEIYACDDTLRNGPVLITGDIPLYDLIPRSAAVIGFNTLAMLEATLADVPVIVPCWSDARKSKDQCLLYYGDELDSKVAYYPESANELRNLLDAALNDALPPKSDLNTRLMRFSQQGEFTIGQTASERVEAFVRQFIN